jgi:hypothetical protein
MAKKKRDPTKDAIVIYLRQSHPLQRLKVDHFDNVVVVKRRGYITKRGKYTTRKIYTGGWVEECRVVLPEGWESTGYSLDYMAPINRTRVAIWPSIAEDKEDEETP